MLGVANVSVDDRGIVVVCPGCGQKNRLAFDHLAGAVRCGACKAALSAPAFPLEIQSAADFDRLISRSSLPVVVDYWAAWCGPCRMVAPEIQKVAARRAGQYVVVKVNTEELGELGDRFGIRSIPTLAVFLEGREVARTSGARPASEIEAFVDQATRQAHARRA
jgi:thioredoxin 2